jgi:hypothetical protein
MNQRREQGKNGRSKCKMSEYGKITISMLQKKVRFSTFFLFVIICICFPDDYLCKLNGEKNQKLSKRLGAKGLSLS